MYKCEKCGKEVYEKFGSGRFCSRSCANSTCRYKNGKWSKYNPQYFCPYCEKGYISEQKLNNHIIQQHKEIKNVKVGKTLLNITYKELEEYKKDHPVCEICGKPENRIYKMNGKEIVINNLCIDHDHTNNKFRGLLCSKCNRFLGGIENLNLEKITNYIKKTK